MKTPLHLTLNRSRFFISFAFLAALLLTWMVMIGVNSDFCRSGMVWTCAVGGVVALVLAAAVAFVGCALMEVMSALVTGRLKWCDLWLPGGLTLLFVMILVLYLFAPVLAMTLEVLFWVGLLAGYVLTRIPQAFASRDS